MNKLLYLCLAFTISNCVIAVNRTDFIPRFNAHNINVDTHLSIIFSYNLILQNKGIIRVYRKRDDKLVDKLDLSIPTGPIISVNHGKNIPPYTPVPYRYDSVNYTNANTKPGTPSGLAIANSDTLQLNIIGRFTDAFHFYPVIVHGNIANIYLHNNMLQYDETYYVQIDSTVFSTSANNCFKGIYDKSWVFTTKKSAPDKLQKTFIVDTSGNGDFNTVQGAVDFLPDKGKTDVTILIRKGEYEEIVYFRNKSHIIFQGEGKEDTKVSYSNNEVFNPHPSNLSTNEWPGTFPSRRAAFACDNSTDIRFENFTIATTAKGQAEGLLIMGQHNSLRNMHIIGSGDALQINGSAYLENCVIDGDGDTYLGRGPVYFNRCRINSRGTFFWIRNTDANHGVVLNHCELVCSIPDGETEIARAPANSSREYPYCEAVLLNCKLSGISPIGWGTLGKNTTNVHYWEFNSVNLSDGKSVTTTQRHPASRQLTLEKDKALINEYSSPENILDGWNPILQ
jgi:pectinesterase